MSLLKEVYLGFSKKQRIFILLAMLCGFFISADYAIIRPGSQSLFVHFFGAKMLPYVWVCSIPFNLMIVSLHNYFLPRWGCFRFFAVTATSVALINASAALFIGTRPGVSFCFYIWKEVYILLMFQQLWAIIHSTVNMKDAKYLYGVLFGFGAFGGFLGSLVPGFLATSLGSDSLLFFSFPLYSVLTVSFFYLLKHSGSEEVVSSEKTKPFASLGKGMRLINSSTLLKAILVMSVFMQVTATLADFQCQSFLEGGFPDRDLRTACAGKLVSLGNMLTMSLQFFGIFLCVRLCGLQRAHLTVPVVLGLVCGISLLVPSFSAVATFFVILKAFEFSLFTVIKEMLYIPMRPEEKFQAKPVIDIFAGRFVKIVASGIIALSQFLFPAYITPFISWLSLAIFLGWAFLVSRIGESYKEAAIPPVRE